MKQMLLPVYFVLICFSSCNLPNRLYLGAGNKNQFDSSEIVFKRADRLAYVDFFDYKTTIHKAGSMSKKAKVNSIGLFSAFRSTYTYGWEGAFTFSSTTDSALVQYNSTVGDEIIGDYALLSPMRMLGLHKEEENNVVLTVRGVINQHLNSSKFMFYNQSLNIRDVLGGYMLYGNDSILLKNLDSGFTKRNTLINKSDGYGLFKQQKLLAAIDIYNKPMKIYIRNDLDTAYKNSVATFLSVIVGNKKIVTRKSTFLKRLL